MAFDFFQRRVVVCGGSRGIGRSIALAFARAGAKVSICARGREALEATKAELGAEAHAAACDLAEAAEIERYIAEAAAALGGLDVLVNNASALGRGGEEEAWQGSLAVDVMATVRAVEAALPHLEASEAGAIVNVSSISGLRASLRNPAYAAAKAALINLTASQGALLAAKGIRANAVAPGSIEFPGGTWEQCRTSDPTLYEATRQSIPLGGMGAPEAVADAVLFLASPYARWVTGQTLAVDGGQALR